MEQIPDYSFYTLDDLLDVKRCVNQTLFPERYAAILEEIEKRRLQGVPIPDSAVQDTALLMVVRFFGGMVLAASLPLLLVGVALAAEVPYGYGIEVSLFLVVIAMIVAVPAGGIYAARHLQEAKIAQRRLSVGWRFVLGCLSLLLRFCGGLVLANFASTPLAIIMTSSSIPPGSSLETAVMIFSVGVYVLGGVLAVFLPMGRKRWF